MINITNKNILNVKRIQINFVEILRELKNLFGLNKDPFFYAFCWTEDFNF